MSIQEMERRFRELKAKFDAGALSAKKFESEVAKLHFRDAQNRWWMLGVQSGNWYWYDGSQWVPGQPPVPAEPAASPPPPEWSRQPAKPAAPIRNPMAPVPVARPAAPSKNRVEATPIARP